MKKAFFIALLFFLSSYVPAQAAGVPTIFSYQGRLTNAAGNLLGDSGTTYYFKFSIWNVATDGTSGVNRLWPSGEPSAVSATVRQGVFNVDIDTSSYNSKTENFGYSFCSGFRSCFRRRAIIFWYDNSYSKFGCNH
jgi:hypothetical protein